MKSKVTFKPILEPITELRHAERMFYFDSKSQVLTCTGYSDIELREQFKAQATKLSQQKPTVIEIDGINLNNEARVGTLLQQMHHHAPDLVELRFKNCDLSDNAVATLADAIGTEKIFKNLKTLRLEGNHIGPASSAALSMLEAFHTLEVQLVDPKGDQHKIDAFNDVKSLNPRGSLVFYQDVELERTDSARSSMSSNSGHVSDPVTSL